VATIEAVASVERVARLHFDGMRPSSAHWPLLRSMETDRGLSISTSVKMVCRWQR
jgi:hypothetical protein